MSSLNVDNLKKYRNEILKAEIGALLFNLGKTHIGFSFWRDYFPHKFSDFKFSSYKEYPEKYFYSELEQISPQLKNFFENINVNLGFLNTNFIEVLKGKESKEEFIQKIFFRGCENINSGIDKGAPNKKLALSLWLSNAFGSFKEEVKEYNFDQRRLRFYANLLIFLDKHRYFQSPNWSKIRNFILKEIKNWYSHLLSDSRFPVNDVSLFDQAYMTASMFKAVLSQLVMDNSKLKSYKDTPSSIKWRILGIQYDKMGIAEKSLKLASIAWYRETAKKIDEELKKLLEVEYPIGNGIYRDETGIYFLVGENLGEDLNDGSNLARLRKEFHEIEEKILEIFKTKTEGEFYPAIFLTKASRGLMNLSHLLETAKENFLKANWSRNDLDISTVRDRDDKAIGICPVCQVRLIYEKDKEKKNNQTICEICDNRIHHAQTSKWLSNIAGETIWTEEVKDKNDRIAYVSFKFELQDWLNGNMLNSLITNKSNFRKLFKDIKLSILSENKLLQKLQNLFSDYFKQIILNANLLSLSINGNMLSNKLPTNERKNIGKIISIFSDLKKRNLYSKFNDHINRINAKIQTIFSSTPGFFEALQEIEKLIKSDINIQNFESFLRDKGKGFGRLDENIQFLERYKSIPEIKQLLDEILIHKNGIDLAKKILRENKQTPELENLASNFVPFSISREILKYYYQYGNLKNFYQETFFNSTIGTEWEKWIKSIISESKIDWEHGKINWEKFTDENDPDLGLLATLLLQFLLRKNPSPARLRRIWETTQEFFEDIHKNLDEILEIPDWRNKRPIWEINLNGNNNFEKSMELEGEGLLFWAEKEGDKAKIYLISSIEDFLKKFGNEEIKEILNKEDANEIPNIFKSKVENEEIPLKQYKTDKVKIKLMNIKNDLKDITTYKPFASITEPSPINYQVIIPVEYLPNLIDKVLERYNKEFKYVYGKLPIHIGVVIADYKKPVYIGLRALRKIRRDVREINNLYADIPIGKFCVLHKEKLQHAIQQEKLNNTEEYYSLYWDNWEQKDYNFYIKPYNNWKKWISTISKFNVNSGIQIIPNTIDFEFLDTNTRRNDIYYNKKGKRFLKSKQNRPYNWSEWEKFKEFKNLFKDKSNQLHNLIALTFSKMDDWKDSRSGEESFKKFMNSALRNFEKQNEVKFEQLGFDVENFDFNEAKKFIDMFEFWHTALKEV